jgi:hypothetical protein
MSSHAIPSPDTEIVSDTTFRQLLLIESLTFKDGNKWRVHDGTRPFHAVIEDKEFLATIDSGKQFGKGDVLVVDLRGVQTIIGAKLATDWTIVKVLEHRRPLQHTLL